MTKKILLLTIGLVLCAGVVYLGIHANENSLYLIAFGIASALIAPVGLSAIGYAFKRDNDRILEKLSRVPELERLASEAKSHEEKIKRLEEERQRLLEIVKFEAQKASLVDKKELLEADAQRILSELDTVDSSLAKLDVDFNPDISSKEVVELYERLKARQRGDIVLRIGKQYFRFSRLTFERLPFGSMAWHYFKLFEWLLSEVLKIRFKRRTMS